MARFQHVFCKITFLKGLTVLLTMSYRNFLYIHRYQNGRRSPTVNNRQRLTDDCTVAAARTQTIHTSYVAKCSVLCVGHFSYGYGSNCQRGTPAREPERDWRASEVELREERLCVRRERDRTRRATRSKEEREAALLGMRAYGRSRVTRDRPLAAIMYETDGESSCRAYR